MTTSNDFKNGMIIRMNNVLYTIVEFLHVKPGKGGAFVRSKLKNLLTGSVIEKTFRGGEKVEDVTVERTPLEFSYMNVDNYVFMDNKTYEQFEVTKEKVGAVKDYIVEGIEVICYFLDNEIILIEPPISVNLKVVETQPGVKGNTVSGGSKPATLETGLIVNVPLFINENDTIKVDTRTNSYKERV
ncbi:elongation factor P [bacterium]|nr:elongation factor P [bacterium]